MVAPACQILGLPSGRSTHGVGSSRTVLVASKLTFAVFAGMPEADVASVRPATTLHGIQAGLPFVTQSNGALPPLSSLAGVTASACDALSAEGLMEVVLLLPSFLSDWLFASMASLIHAVSAVFISTSFWLLVGVAPQCLDRSLLPWSDCPRTWRCQGQSWPHES